MLVLDASVLFDVLVRTTRGEGVRQRVLLERDWAAPHVIDAEVLGAIRGHFLRGLLDRTAATQAVEDLRDWPGQRFGHRALLDRAWELRATVRSWDALYVALAEQLGAPLLTLDARLARAQGLLCTVEVVPNG